MLGVVASNGEKMPLVWFERCYRLQKVPCVRKVTKKSDYVFQQDRVPAHAAKTLQDWLNANRSVWPKDFYLPQLPNSNPLDFSFARHTTKGLQDIPQQHRWAQGFCKPYMAVDEEGLRQENLQIFRPRLERVIIYICTLNNLMSLGVNVYLSCWLHWRLSQVLCFAHHYYEWE